MTTSAQIGTVIACVLALAACGQAGEAPATKTVPSSPATPSSPTAPTTSSGWCRAGDLKISTSEGAGPSDIYRSFTINLESAKGSACTIGGTLSDVRFLSSSGTELDVPIAGGQQDASLAITVDPAHPAVVYLKAPKDAKPEPVKSISFTLPGNGQPGDPVLVDWIAPLGGPVQLGLIAAPVS
ncbi:hypothetical protein ACIA8G_09295 [Lentzea sp. NPDC051213]|uniref:hypothetical protein n=1 Tax=Lentzea sp. NPDC051213 TaxID=3364126 RepID=UPI003798593F